MNLPSETVRGYSPPGTPAGLLLHPELGYLASGALNPGDGPPIDFSDVANGMFVAIISTFV